MCQLLECGIMEGMKRCSRCDSVKQFSDFGADPRLKLGLNSECRPCKKKVDAESYQKNKEKRKITKDRWRAANPDKTRGYARKSQSANKVKAKASAQAWRSENPERVKANADAWRAANPEKSSAYVRAWQAANPEKAREIAKAWRHANPALVAFYSTNRRAAKLLRTPKWLTEDDFQTMKLFYELAKGMEIATGVKHHVDHEIPLRGDLASGLHCPLNLQIIPASENCSKHNKWDPQNDVA